MEHSLEAILSQESWSNQIKNHTEIIFKIFGKRNPDLNDLNPSIIRLVAMSLSDDTYTIFAKIEDQIINGNLSTGFQPIAGYSFEDNQGRHYHLRLEDALILIELGKVSNVELNNRQPYLKGSDSDLRKLPRKIIVPQDLYTRDEWERLLQQTLGLQDTLGITSNRTTE